MTPALPVGAVKVFGVTLVGVSTTTGVKLLFTLALVALVLVRLELSLRFLVPHRGVRAVKDVMSLVSLRPLRLEQVPPSRQDQPYTATVERSVEPSPASGG